jgi:hypothetical protein
MAGIFKRSILSVTLLAGLAFIATATAQPIPSTRSGIKHVVMAKIAPATVEAQISDLSIAIEISDHARETHFFGRIPVRWRDFATTTGGDEQIVWADKQCHQRRGLPSAKVLTITGYQVTLQSRSVIAAVPRHTGRLVPSDEVVHSQALQGGQDEVGQYFLVSVQTTASHLVVLLKIYALDCSLD